MNKADVPQAVYRTALPADLKSIAALEAEVFQEPYLFLMLRQLFDLHGEQWLIAELDGELIGYALLLEKGGRALLFTFAVAQQFQHNGYGRGLLRKALQHCRDTRVEVLRLTVRPDNHPAANLFKQAGFEFMRRDDTYFGPDEPRDLFEYWFRK